MCPIVGTTIVDGGRGMVSDGIGHGKGMEADSTVVFGNVGSMAIYVAAHARGVFTHMTIKVVVGSEGAIVVASGNGTALVDSGHCNTIGDVVAQTT